MSYRAGLVLRAIEQAIATHDRHPTLFAAQLRNDRDCQQLARAVDRYKREQPVAHARPFRDEVEGVDAPVHVLDDDRARHTRDRLRSNSKRRERRLEMTGLDLVREVLRELPTVSTVKAGNVEPSRGGSETGGVPDQQRIEDDPRWKLADGIIKRHAMSLLELVDEARGFGRSDAVASLTTEEKDAAIRLVGEGKTAESAWLALGDPGYGSISYIRRKRKDWDLDTRGYPKADQ